MSHGKHTLGDPMMLSLFRTEIETHTETLNSGILKIEKDFSDTSEAESLMRAAHSIKGAARILNIDMAVTLAHAMESLFDSMQAGTLLPAPDLTDKLLCATDILRRIGELASDETIDELMALSPEVDMAVASFDAPGPAEAAPEQAAPKPQKASPGRDRAEHAEPTVPSRSTDVRISATHIDRLMGLAGEVMVRGYRLGHFADAFKMIATRLANISHTTNTILQPMKQSNESYSEQMGDLAQNIRETHEELIEHLNSFDSLTFDFIAIATGIHDEAIASRMRPFSDGVAGFPRMVRDIAKALNRDVRFEIVGRDTRLDRNILRELEAPITHLLRNALAHGLEPPEERERAGKSKTGTMTLEASHCAGQLLVVVKDDVRGIDIDILRRTVVERRLTDRQTAAKLSDEELLQFIFLPGFSTTPTVTKLSGRGYGLNVVSEMLQAVNGSIQISSDKGVGTEVRMLLPLTRSVVRSLVFELSNEYYAFPLSQIGCCTEILYGMLSTRDGATFINHNEVQLPLIDGHAALQLPREGRHDGKMTAIIIGSGDNAVAITVDCCVGEQNLVIRPLDARLGPVPVVSSASIMKDGSTVLSLDIENLLHMAHKSSREHSGIRDTSRHTESLKQQILIVEDSITVREMERKLLEEHGYDVETAIDGLDGWNALTADNYDLIISDVDMPRMNGLELISKIRADLRFKDVPVIIVSYKDSERDRKRGMDAGADYYMTKHSFHDKSIIEVVHDLLRDTINEDSNS